MRQTAILIVLTLLAVPAVFAQRLKIELPAGLAERAAEPVDITLDGDLLRPASKFMSDDGSTGGRAARDMVRNLKGIYVRSFEFDKEGEYDRGIIGKLRAQLGPGWQKVV